MKKMFEHLNLATDYCSGRVQRGCNNCRYAVMQGEDEEYILCLKYGIKWTNWFECLYESEQSGINECPDHTFSIIAVHNSVTQWQENYKREREVNKKLRAALRKARRAQ